MMKMKKFKSLMLAAALMGLSSVTSYAATTVSSFIDVKFSPNKLNPVYNYSGAVTYGSGAGAVTVGAAGDTWNIFAPDLVAGTPQTLVTTTGPSSSLLTFSSGGATSLYNGTSGFFGGPYSNLMNSYNYVTHGETGNFMIAGLTANTNYDVYVLTQGNLADNGSKLKLEGLNSSGNPFSVTQSGTGLQSNSTLLPGANYIIETFQTDGTGKLNIDFSSASSNGHNAIVNGFQVTNSPSPEPASMLLLGIGGAIMSARKLRKKKAAESLVS
jgi:hypothetical protein